LLWGAGGEGGDRIVTTAANKDGEEKSSGEKEAREERAAKGRQRKRRPCRDGGFFSWAEGENHGGF
jgi:hypothetical protein